jgi:hypothetical protein
VTATEAYSALVTHEQAGAHWLLPDEDHVELFVRAGFIASRVDDPAICSQIPVGSDSHVICFECPIPDAVGNQVERVERLTLPHPWSDIGEAVGWRGGVLDDRGVKRLKHVLTVCRCDVDDDEPDHCATFPTEVLPRFVREMVEHGASAQCVDRGFWAVTALPLLAGCIGNSRRVRIKRTWTEPSVLFAAVIANSGVGKSAPLRELAKPIRSRDKDLALRNQVAAELHRAECASAREAKEPPPEPPPILSVVLDDATLEAVGARLADNPRGLILINDELAGWMKSMDKYRAGDDQQKWLRINGADSLKFDRKGGQRQQFVPRAAVSVVGGMQPKVAARHLSGEAIESGASARILIARPPARPAVWTDDDIPQAVVDGWRRLCDSLLDLTHDLEAPRTLDLSVDARKLFVEFHNENGRACHAASESGDGARAAVLSKLRGYAVRLALIFELCKSAEDGTAELAESVGVESMAAGITVVDWFAAEAVKLYREFSAATPDAEQRLDDRILALLRERGRVSEGAIRGALSRHPSSDDVRSSLRRLEVAGYVRFAGSERTGGRPRRMWELSE